jgi:hypothetical protein
MFGREGNAKNDGLFGIDKLFEWVRRKSIESAL